MGWTAIILKGPDAKPFVIEDMKEEKPKDWSIWAYGDNQENKMGLFRVGVCEETQTAYLLKALQWENGEVILNPFGMSQGHIEKLLEVKV